MIPQCRNRSAAKIDCRRQSEGRGEAESQEHHLPYGYETASQDRPRRSETGQQARSQIASKFRAHGAEIFASTTRALHQAGAAAARKAARRLKTIAGQVVQQLDAGLPAEIKDRCCLETAMRVLN